MNTQFILGLVCGEGSFYCTASVSESSRYNIKFRYGFQLEMKDGELIESVKQEIDAGKIYSESYKNGKLWRLTIRSSEISKLIEFIENADSEEFKISRKSDSYKKWKEAIRSYKNVNTKSDMKETIKLASEINEDGKGFNRNNELFEAIESYQEHYCNYEKDNGELCSKRVGSENETCHFH